MRDIFQEYMETSIEIGKLEKRRKALKEKILSMGFPVGYSEAFPEGKVGIFEGRESLKVIDPMGLFREVGSDRLMESSNVYPGKLKEVIGEEAFMKIVRQGLASVTIGDPMVMFRAKKR